MKEIKSFREYIEEQNILKEADKPGFLETAEEKIAKKYSNPDQKTDSNSKPLVHGPEGEEDAKPTNAQEKQTEEDDDKKVSQPSDALKVADYNMKLTGDYVSQVSQMKEQIRVLRNTLSNLESFVTTSSFVSSKKGEKLNANDISLNITHGNSLKKIKDAWVDKWKSEASGSKKIDKIIRAVKTLQSKGSYDYGAKERELAFETLANNISYLDQNTQNLINSVINKNKPVEEGISNLFRSSYSIASSSDSKHSPYRILSTAKYKLDDFRNINDEYINKIYQDYVKDSIAIIRKESKTIKNYLDSAETKLKKYESRYTRINDAWEIENISNDIGAANSGLQRIGRMLETKMVEFQQALGRLSNEVKNVDEHALYELKGANTYKAVKNYIVNDLGKAADEIIASRESKAKSEAEKAESEARKEANTRKIEAEKEAERIKSDEAEENKKRLTSISDERNAEALADALNFFKKPKIGYITKWKNFIKKEDFAKEIENLKSKTDFKNDKNKNIAEALRVLYALFKDGTLKAYRHNKAGNDYIEDEFVKKYNSLVNEFNKKSSEKLISDIEKDTKSIFDRMLLSHIRRKGLSDKEKEALKNTTEQKPSDKSSENTQTKKAGTAAVNYAKDFDDSEPTNIYAYAVQKAKKLQER